MATRIMRMLGLGRSDAQAGAPDGAAAAAQSSVLFVCMGNICRSPTAEGVFRHKLAQAGLAGRVRLDSAGTHGYHSGEAPDPRAIRHAAARGYALQGLRARPVQPQDFLQFRYMLAMDQANLTWLRRHAPGGASAQLGLLMPFAPQAGADDEVPDPYFGAPAGFDQVLNLVEAACDGLLARLQAELRAAEPIPPPSPG